MLLVIGGLPGVGKTTVARELATRLRAAHVRIDALEAGLVSAGLAAPGDLGPAGYDLALAVADSCLAAGGDVVADAVFPVAASRAPWTELAQRHATSVRWVRLVCSDLAEHRRRVERRTADLPGLALPDWAAVLGREVDEWAEPHDVVDTAGGGPAGGDAADAVEVLLATPATVVRRHVAGLAPRLSVRRLVAGTDGVVAAELTETWTTDGGTTTAPLAGWYRVHDGRIAEAHIYREGSAEVS